MSNPEYIDNNEVCTIYKNEAKEIPAGKGSIYTTLYFVNEKDISGFTYEKSGKNLLIKNGNQTVTLLNYFTKENSYSTQSKIDTILNSTLQQSLSIIDDKLITSTPDAIVVKKGKVEGTVFADVIDMHEYTNSKNKGLTIDAKSGDDEITGSRYNDTIIGGTGKNIMYFDFNTEFGKDIIKLTPYEQLTLSIKNGENLLELDDLTLTKENNDYIITYGDNAKNQIVLKDYFKGGSASESATVSINEEDLGEYVKQTVLNITGKGKIYGTNFNDNIIGSEKNDTIYAYAGDDTIATKGGKDTVVLTGIYGKDTIDSIGSSKVTVKLASFDSNNISFINDDLEYTTDDKSGFVYKNFLNNTSADLWISAGKKSYNISSNSDAVADYSKSKSNDVVFLSSDENQTYNGSKKGINTVYSGEQNVVFNYKGGNDTYISDADSDDSYTAKITKSTKLVINDIGGNDSLALNNKSNDLTLFFDVTRDEQIADDDLVIYNKSAVSYKNLVKANSGATIENYFNDGGIETITLQDNNIDMEGWIYFVKVNVADYLIETNYNSASELLEKGTKKEKTILANIYKTSTYQSYLDTVKDSVSHEEWKFTKDGDNLVYYVQSKGEAPYGSIKDFFGKNAIYISYYALNEEGKLQKYVVGSKDAPIYITEFETSDNKRIITGTNYSDYVELNAEGVNEYEVNLLGGDDTVVVTENDTTKTIITENGSEDTLIFNDRKYADFYTKGELSGAYTAGDPLIQKSGNDLKIGEDVTVKDIDGYESTINIVDKDGATKTIIIGSGEINGTFESEIIIGSNGVDTVNTNGNNDLVWLGGGNDTLNMTTQEKGAPTGKNTAEMIGIGGTHTIANDLAVPASSVYSASGDDTYNTTLTEYGLYIEDYSGNDTLNIIYSDDSLMYLFDVVNPKHASENPTLYTDLMICDKSQFMSAGISAFSTATGGVKEILESMQGTFGYAWIDDHFGNAQTIENINIINDEGVSNALDVNSAISDTKQAIAAWLASDSGFFKPSGDFSTAWDVLERGSKTDKAYLANLYMS